MFPSPGIAMAKSNAFPLQTHAPYVMHSVTCAVPASSSDEKCHNGIIIYRGFRDSQRGNCPQWQLQGLLIIKAVAAAPSPGFVSLILYCFIKTKQKVPKQQRCASRRLFLKTSPFIRGLKPIMPLLL